MDNYGRIGTGEGHRGKDELRRKRKLAPVSTNRISHNTVQEGKQCYKDIKIKRPRGDISNSGEQSEIITVSSCCFFLGAIEVVFNLSHRWCGCPLRSDRSGGEELGELWVNSLHVCR